MQKSCCASSCVHRCLSETGSSIQNHHQEIQLGNVLLCHCLLLLCWVSGKPVCHLQMSGYLLYCPLHKSISNALCRGSWEMGVLLGWHAWKTNFLVWKCDMVMVLDVMWWEHSYFYSHFHIQYLLMCVLVWRHHSMWSWSDLIILPLQLVIGAGQCHCRRRLCTLSQQWCWVFEGPSTLSKTTMLQLRHSIWRILRQTASILGLPWWRIFWM